MEEQTLYVTLFIVEAFIAWIYFEYLFSRKQKDLFFSFTFIISYILLFLLSKFNLSALNTIGFCSANFFLVVINYQCAYRTAFLHAAFLSFIMLIAEVLVAILISLFGHEFAAYTYNFSVKVALVILSKLLYLVLSIIGARVFAPHKQKNEEPRLMILFCGLPLFSMIIAILIIYLGTNSEMTHASRIMMVITILALLIVNLLFLILYNYLQKAHHEHLALQISLQQEQADAAYYQAQQTQFENQRILIHDIKNHLNAIAGLAQQKKNDEIVAYVVRLEATLGPAKQIRLCTDPILNILLLQFSEKCKKHNIDFQCDIRENCVSFMDAPSITTLYGNLLTNAFEAAVTSTERSIELFVIHNIEQSFVAISVINSCDIPPATDESGFFLTRKDDKAIHGVGLKSISRIVKKYDGISTLYYDKDKKRFHHLIQFSS